MNYKKFNPEQHYKEVTEELHSYVIARDSELCQVYGIAGNELHHVKYRSKGVVNKASNLILLSSKAHYEEHNVFSRDVKYYFSRIKKNEVRFRKGLV